ncbi:MAG TPA: metallophosphoesterase family protein [Kofleriaceae bacterium]
MKRIVVVSDTHSKFHAGTLAAVRALDPDVIFHAGDIGELDVLSPLREIAPLYAIRGNIDGTANDLADAMVIDHEGGMRTLLLHIGVYGPKLRAEVGRQARAEKAHLVVCGHSHVPFIGVDKGTYIFNPGSCGPRRMTLPIVFGHIDFTPTGVKMAHVNCETGLAWAP